MQCSILNPFHILKILSQLLERAVKSIAETMVKYKIGSVVIEENSPIGIITDKDLRSKIAGNVRCKRCGPNYVGTGNHCTCKPVCC
jgi:signal-transduction protein with cAMP-binding, CBS, and nucleotidyltransferase domain